MGSQIAVYFVIGLFSILAVYLIIKGIKNRQERERVAAERGWQYVSTPERNIQFRISGTSGEGIPWNLETRRKSSSSTSHSSSISTSTRWWTEVVTLPNHLVMLGPAQEVPEGLAFGSGLTQLILKVMIGDFFGDVGAERLGEVREVDPGSPDLRQHFTVFSTDEEVARQFLNFETESALLDYIRQEPKKDRYPMVVFWDRQLQVRVQSALTDMPTIERLIELGNSLASSQVR
jgi:hypothetical protein